MACSACVITQIRAGAGMSGFDRLLADLARPEALVELAALFACLALAWALAWSLGRERGADSIWFGRSTFDGLLFPLLSLVLVYGARLAVAEFQRPGLLRVAVPVLVALVGIRFIARMLAVSFPQSAAARLGERVFSWGMWIIAVLWIAGWLPLVRSELESIRFAMGKSRISLLDLIEGLLWSGVVLVGALWVSAAIERKLLRDAVSDLSLRKVAGNAIRALLLLTGMLVALSAVGVDLTALSVLGGALGVGLGFGLQKLAANYVSGFVILFERSLRIGDTVRVDQFEGTVMDIKTRYTLIRALNGRESVVPNEMLITQRIENLSLADPRVLLSVPVTVGYEVDTDAVAALLEQAAVAAARVLRDPVPSAKLARIGSGGLEYELTFWIEDPQNGQLNVRSEVNVAIIKALRGAGVVIPSPHHVVRLEGAEPVSPSSKATTG